MTTLSQPHETMSGLLAEGEKRTQLTHSVWPSSWIVYLHSPSVFHSLIVLSRAPETIWRLSAENATASTSFSCETKRRVVRPELMSQRRSVPSQLPESANWPSDEMVMSCTKCEWPRSERLAVPHRPSSSFSRLRFQTMTDLSREPESSMPVSSIVLAMHVTQSLWPLSTPRKVRVSVMLAGPFCAAGSWHNAFSKEARRSWPPDKRWPAGARGALHCC